MLNGGEGRGVGAEEIDGVDQVAVNVHLRNPRDFAINAEAEAAFGIEVGRGNEIDGGYVGRAVRAFGGGRERGKRQKRCSVPIDDDRTIG